MPLTLYIALEYLFFGDHDYCVPASGASNTCTLPMNSLKSYQSLDNVQKSSAREKVSNLLPRSEMPES